VNKNSSLSEHGLDSLDAIEISMQIEEDLGYTISAETLPSFTKVNHYITYIEQVEAFKRENNKNPIA
jgi:acyl carrier protein